MNSSYEILRLYIGSQTSILSNKLVTQLTNFIESKLNNYNIFLYGNSLGGALCNAIAEKVKIEKANKYKLNIFTYGSIYIYNNVKMRRNDNCIKLYLDKEGLNIRNLFVEHDIYLNRFATKYDPEKLNIEYVTLLYQKKMGMSSNWLIKRL